MISVYWPILTKENIMEKCQELWKSSSEIINFKTITTATSNNKRLAYMKWADRGSFNAMQVECLFYETNALTFTFDYYHETGSNTLMNTATFRLTWFWIIYELIKRNREVMNKRIKIWKNWVRENSSRAI